VREAKPNVIINRFEQRVREYQAGRRQEILGDHFVGGISTTTASCAVDRGIPLQEIDPNANVINDSSASSCRKRRSRRQSRAVQLGRAC
jgi:pilus assembly protein CpaE